LEEGSYEMSLDGIYRCSDQNSRRKRLTDVGRKKERTGNSDAADGNESLDLDLVGDVVENQMDSGAMEQQRDED
jgi:hypothetical protein